MADCLATLDSLSSLRDGLANGDASARLQALELCRTMQAELENPEETLMKFVWAEPIHYCVLNIAQDLKIFSILSEDNESPKSSAQIAERCKADPILIGRLMRVMAAMYSVAEVGPDLFANTKFSRSLLTEEADSTFGVMRWNQIVLLKTPEYLAQHGYKSPSDPKKTPFAWARRLGEMTWFGYMSQDAKLGQMFARMMRFTSGGGAPWSDGRQFPVKEKLHSVEDPDGVLVVDIAGSYGHDLEWFRNNNPELKGRLILQDLPYIIEKVKLEGIEAMAHDFYEEQPIKGAQVYYLHRIIHDYEDEACLKIIRAIVPAMKPGYSRLLIHDMVLPDRGTPWFTTSLDFLLMTALCSRERTKTQFVDLINQVGGGLRLEKIWPPTIPGELHSIIECVVDP